VNQFLTHLAVDKGRSAATQSQARAALMFLYREVLDRDLAEAGRPVLKGKNPKRLPTVLSRSDVGRVLAELRGVHHLVVSLLYGSGLRLQEALTLRVKDIDLERRQVTIRAGKGGRQRVSVVPASLTQRFDRHLRRRQTRHERDLAEGCGHVVLPGPFARKSPRAATEFLWQFLFPSATANTPTQTGARGRSHLHPSSVQRAVRKAAKSIGLRNRVTCHTFRHSFATHLLEDGYDIRTIQELLGHRSVKTTMIYTHVVSHEAAGIRSPLDTVSLE
jgi:integron integrase